MARSLSMVDLLPTGLECSLCSEVPLRPKVLTCSHAFCDDCLARFYQCEGAPALQVICPICGNNTRLVVVDEKLLTSSTKSTRKPPKTMPKPKPPLRTTDRAEVVITRKFCEFNCDPSSLSVATSSCSACGLLMCAQCTEDHALMMDSHEVKRLYPKTGRSIGSSADLHQWRDKLGARLKARRSGRLSEGSGGLPIHTKDDLEAGRSSHSNAVRSADLSKWREDFEARKQNIVNDRAKDHVNGHRGNGNPIGPERSSSSSGRVPLQKGTSFPPLASPDDNWCLEGIQTFRPSGREVWCMNPAEEGGVAVGYLDGGVRIFNVDGPRKTIFKDVPVQGFATLSDGRYVVRDAWNKIKILYPDGRRAGTTCSLSANGGFGGLGVDSFDNIYIGRWRDGRIDVLRPNGGDVIREIPCHGYEPWDICAMRGSSMLVVSGGSFVGVIDEKGRIKHEIVSHFGEDAHIAVLHDDQVLIGWLRDGVMNIDLYTAQLKHERSVLVGFPVNSSVSNKCCLREFASGEIALSDFERFTVFRKIVPPIR